MVLFIRHNINVELSDSSKREITVKNSVPQISIPHLNSENSKPFHIDILFQKFLDNILSWKYHYGYWVSIGFLFRKVESIKPLVTHIDFLQMVFLGTFESLRS